MSRDTFSELQSYLERCRWLSDCAFLKWAPGFVSFLIDAVRVDSRGVGGPVCSLRAGLAPLASVPILGRDLEF